MMDLAQVKDLLPLDKENALYYFCGLVREFVCLYQVMRDGCGGVAPPRFSGCLVFLRGSQVARMKLLEGEL